MALHCGNALQNGESGLSLHISAACRKWTPHDTTTTLNTAADTVAVASSGEQINVSTFAV